MKSFSSSRRRILFGLASATALAAVRLTTRTSPVFAADAPQALDEADPQAKALGYRSDTTKVDSAKYPTHTNEQHCGVCQLYTGTIGSETGPCTLFQGKTVTSNGWCSAWVKKTG